MALPRSNQLIKRCGNKPHVPDAWMNHAKTKIGYEINFNRYFYQYTPPRPLEEIETDLLLRKRLLIC